MKTTLIAVSSLLLSLAASPAGASGWAVDASHSRVGFSVRHMMVSNTKGEFTQFDGAVDLDDRRLDRSSVRFEIDVASIDTRDEKRDAHLRGADFFESAKYPKIQFVSKRVRKTRGGYRVTGDLTMHGVRKEVSVDVALSKAIKNPWGKTVRGASIRGELDRQAFGVTWNKTLDGGGLVVGNKVSIDIELELVAQDKTAAAL